MVSLDSESLTLPTPDVGGTFAAGIVDTRAILLGEVKLRGANAHVFDDASAILNWILLLIPMHLDNGLQLLGLPGLLEEADPSGEVVETFSDGLPPLHRVPVLHKLLHRWLLLALEDHRAVYSLG